MDSLTDIYQLLRCEGLCATQADFSRDWMGRSAHYLSQIDGDPAKASPTSLQLLASRLDTAAEAAREQWRLIADYNQLSTHWRPFFVSKLIHQARCHILVFASYLNNAQPSLSW